MERFFPDPGLDHAPEVHILTWFQLVFHLIVLLFVCVGLHLPVLIVLVGSLLVDPVAGKEACSVVGVTEGSYDVGNEGLLQLRQLWGGAVHEGADG